MWYALAFLALSLIAALLGLSSPEGAEATLAQAVGLAFVMMAAFALVFHPEPREPLPR